MADYSQVNDYSAKDALATGNPLKLIKGSDVDAEFSAISTAISSKFDSTDIATAGEAQAGVDNTVIITPARLTAWAQNDAGVVEDLQALSDPGADRILFWDESADDTTFLTVGTGLSITDTTITVDETAFTVDMIAGNGLSGGGTTSTDRTFDLDFNELASLTPVAADILAIADISDTNTVKQATIADLNGLLTLAALSDYDANAAVDHTAVTLTAGEGLTGGGTIAANRTFDLDVDGLTVETTIDVDNDNIPFYDASAGAHRKVSIDALVGDALGDGMWYLSGAVNVTSSEATIVYDTESHDSLEKGTFSTSTGEYTVGAASTRLLITAQYQITDQAETEDGYIYIQKNGTSFVQGTTTNRGQYGASGSVVTATTIIFCAAADVVRVRMMNDGTRAVQVGRPYTQVSIVELA